MNALAITTLLTGLLFTNVSFSAGPGQEVSFNKYVQTIMSTFKYYGQTPSVYIGEDRCSVTLQVTRNSLIVSLYENNRLSAQHVVKATDRIFARGANFYTEYIVGNQLFGIAAGDGIFGLTFGNTITQVKKSCGESA